MFRKRDFLDVDLLTYQKYAQPVLLANRIFAWLCVQFTTLETLRIENIYVSCEVSFYGGSSNYEGMDLIINNTI